MAVNRGEMQAPQFGSQAVSEAIDGLELLTAKKRRRKGSADDDGEDADGEGEGKGNAADFMKDQVLSADDFKKLRKMRLQKSIEMQLGRKRKAEEISSSGSSSEEDSDSSDAGVSDGERG